MAIDIYRTKTMLAAVRQMTPVTSFLRDRYFPTGAGDLFPTEEVLVEYKDASGNRLAPVVMPRKGSISVERDSYYTRKMTPPLVAPSRPLTIDDLNRKGFGEDLFSDRTPAERQADILLQDLQDFDELHTNREEYIAAKCMFENGYVLRQYADKYGEGEYTEYEMKFYDEGSNPAVYVPGVKWNEGASDKMADLHQMIRMLTTVGNAASEVLLGADEGSNPAVYVPGVKWNEGASDKMADLHQMIRMLTTVGNAASEVLLGADAADALLGDTKLKELLDLNNYRIGAIEPAQLPQGAARLGRLNIRGRMIDLLTYDGTYVDEQDGKIKPYIPAKQICVTTPGAGRGLYGAVSQIEQSDNQWHSYMGRRVPRYWTEKNARELTVSSRPLFIPRTKNPFISATVLGE